VKKIVFFIACLIYFNQGYAQDLYSDSLERLIRDQTNPEEQTKLEIKQIEHLRYSDVDLALMKCLECEKKAVKNKSLLILDIQFQLGMIYFSKGEYVQCINFANKLLSDKKNDYSKAIAYFFFGLVNDQNKNRAKALDDYQKSLDYLADLNHKDFKAELYNSMGNHYGYVSKFDESIYYFNEAIKINEANGNLTNLGFNFNNLAGVYERTMKYKEAETKYMASLLISNQVKNNLGKTIALLNLGILAAKQKQFPKSNRFLIEGLNLALKVGVKDVIKIFYLSLYDNFKSTGDFKLALENYELAVVYKDSVENVKSMKSLAFVEGALKKKEDSLVIQKLENSALEQKAKEFEIRKDSERKTIFLISGALVLMLMLVLIVIIIINARKRRKLNQELFEEKVRVENKNEEIVDSINYAKQLQEAILPPTNIFLKYFPDSFILYKPKDIVAGDFYWFEKIGENLFFAAADCTGHGVPGALVSVVCSNALHRAVVEFGIQQPSRILDKTRDLVIETFQRSQKDIKDGMDISLCVFNSNSMVLQWAGANNPLWIQRLNDQKIMEIKASKQSVGKTYFAQPFANHEIVLAKGDCIYLFTDGYADQFGGPKGRKFKYKAFMELLEQMQLKPMVQQHTILNREFDSWRGALEQVDDVCVIGIRV